MEEDIDLCSFAAEPLDRASELRSNPDWIAEQKRRADALLLPLWRGDPLLVDGSAGWLSLSARREFGANTPLVFLGLDKNRVPRFALDCGAVPTPEAAPFADIGVYTPLREASSTLQARELAVVGAARWLLDWHVRHEHCARCGASTDMGDGGAKRVCPACGAEHFPRSDPVAIVLAVHDGACLLGRGPNFPPTFFSALAGYIEACETPEACAIRELKEEAGVELSNVRYQFSQPWPFPSSLMMGFIADAAGRHLVLDTNEVEQAVWVPKADLAALIAGEVRAFDVGPVNVPPRFTIARRLMGRWLEMPA